MNKIKKETIQEIYEIAKSSKENKDILINVSTKLGCLRYFEDCNIIKRQVKKNSQILDLGCGVGHISYILAKAGYNVTASEIFEKTPLFIEKYNDLYPKKINYINANILENNHSLSNMKFDAVVICGVLEHVPDMRIFLRKIFELLNPGGKLIIQQFPNKYSLFEKINDYRNRSSHDIRLSKYELGLLLSYSTFKVTYSGYHQFLPYALNGIPRIFQNIYFRFSTLIRILDKFLYTFTFTKLGSTSIQIVCSKSASCKS